jgi:hypothetical protein
MTGTTSIIMSFSSFVRKSLARNALNAVSENLEGESEGLGFANLSFVSSKFSGVCALLSKYTPWSIRFCSKARS